MPWMKCGSSHPLSFFDFVHLARVDFHVERYIKLHIRASSIMSLLQSYTQNVNHMLKRHPILDNLFSHDC